MCAAFGERILQNMTGVHTYHTPGDPQGVGRLLITATANMLTIIVRGSNSDNDTHVDNVLNALGSLSLVSCSDPSEYVKPFE